MKHQTQSTGLPAQVASKFPKLDMSKANDCVSLSSAISNGADREIEIETESEPLGFQKDSNGCSKED